MKKAMKFVVMAVAALSTTMNYGSTSDLNIQDDLSIQNRTLTNETPKLVIRNKKGVAVYEGATFSARTKSELVSEMHLPSGEYTYELIGATNVEITSFEVDDDRILFDSKSPKTIFKPTLRIKDDVLLVSQLSLQMEPLKIKMYYNSNEDGLKSFDLIHAEKISEEMILDRAYGLDKSKTGEYKIKFISNDIVFTETFSL